MNTDHHQRFEHLIDESLAGRILAASERSLREHLAVCARCRHYLSASHRVIASLGGFSFDVPPMPDVRTLAARSRPAHQVATTQPDRRRWAWGSIVAVALTLFGSFVDLQFGTLIASILDIQRMPVRHGLLAFWIVPSLFFLLLFPLLPLLSKSGRQGRTI